ncbi:MAG: hypothetical protein CSA89_01285 [Bacteroidales bacterium]|nr:MAG: hypothetical protein CSA89_01285 [Bacteroidales bacterium]
MKGIVWLLAFLFLALNVVAIDDLSPDGAEQAKHCSSFNDNEATTDDCANPFCMCCIQHHAPIQHQVDRGQPVINPPCFLYKSKLNTKRTLVHSNFFAEIWKPPQNKI